ncbi:MAG: lipopolysaccharide heptosyltransferase II [Chitinispirillaceae bacterium]|nr:lipopolysaccharide heptosyltransferase II [Chitinispirillaceae bacterium]
MEKTAILMPNWVGDFILALSVVQNKFVPGDDVTLIVPEKLALLSKMINPFATIIYCRVDELEYQATVQEIRREKFNRIYLLPRSFSAALLSFRSGIPHRRGIQSELRSFLLTDRLPRSTENRSVHLTREYARVLNTSYVPPEFHRGGALKNVARNNRQHTIVLCPGAAFGATKRWPHFGELITKQPQHHFTLLGDKNDVQWVRDRFPSTTPNSNNLVGKTTLAEAAAIIASSTLVVANDSGLLHLAGYLGKPAIGIYGSTSPEWTRPLGTKTIVLSSGCTCAPCFKKACPRSTVECLSSIATDRVVRKIKELLGIIEITRLQDIYSTMVYRMISRATDNRELVPVRVYREYRSTGSIGSVPCGNNQPNACIGVSGRYHTV